jgi:hypothetical protein
MTTITLTAGTPMGFGGPFGSTRRVLREEVGRVFNPEMFESTVSATGTTTTLVDAKVGRFGNDYWIGVECYIQSTQGGDAATAPAGQSSWVTDFVATTGTFTVSPAYTVAPGVDATYQLYKWVSSADINRALQNAAKGAEIATSLTVETDSFDYDLAGAVGLSRRSQIVGVYWRDQADLETMPVRLIYWELEEAEGRLFLRIPQTFTAGDQLWVVYHADENYLTADTLCVNLDREFVVARAVIYLIERILTNQSGGGQDRWGQLLRYWAEKLQRFETSLQRPPRRTKGHNWGAYIAANASDRAEHVLGLEPNY